MRVLILIDGDNFKNGLQKVSSGKKNRILDLNKINPFVINYLKKNIQYKDCKLMHLRTYYYTGEYTEDLIRKAEHLKNKKSNFSKKQIDSLIEYIKNQIKAQQKFLEDAKNYYFLEIRTSPLKFNPSSLKIYQKGVDVQLAVDLVHFAYTDAFDIVVILSGDIDLLESMKSVKNLGKHVIVFGAQSVTSEEIKREADFYIDLERLSKKELNEISHIEGQGDK